MLESLRGSRGILILKGYYKMTLNVSSECFVSDGAPMRRT